MLQEIIVLTVAYVVLIGLLQPSKQHSTATPVDYFPEVEEATTDYDLVAFECRDRATDNTWAEEVTEPFAPVEFDQPAIAATALSPVTIATMPAQPVEVFTQDLSALGVRDLYKLAKGKVKGYKKLSKTQLVEALA